MHLTRSATIGLERVIESFRRASFNLSANSVHFGVATAVIASWIFLTPGFPNRLLRGRASMIKRENL
jgi:hypothetical protein